MTAFTPQASAAFRVDSLRKRNPGTTADRTFLNPDSSSKRSFPPSVRALPIRPARSLESFTIDRESRPELTMSVVEKRPPE